MSKIFLENPFKPFGILLEHYIPVELSITKICTQACRYCFVMNNRKANDSLEGSEVDPTDKVLKKIDKANSPGYNPLSMIEWCLHEKMPILFSNNTDPFLPIVENKYHIAKRVLSKCLEHRQPLSIATKEVFCNENIFNLLVEGKDIFSLYVTITTIDADIAKTYEPGAPSPQEKLRRIKMLTDKGVKVTAGINPFVPEWHPDLRATLTAMKNAGIGAVYTDNLHASKNQFQQWDSIMKQVKPNRHEQFFNEDVKIIEAICQELGLLCEYIGKTNSGISEWTSNNGAVNFFPFSSRWFISELWDIYNESNKKPILVTWNDIRNFYSEFIGWKQVFNISEIEPLFAFTTEEHRQVRHSLGKQNTWENIIRFIYNNPMTFTTFLQPFMGILVSTEGEEKGEAEYLEDDDGNLMYYFDGDNISFGEAVDVDDKDYVEALAIPD